MSKHSFLRNLAGILLGVTLLTSCAPGLRVGWPSSKEEQKRRQEWGKDQHYFCMVLFA